MSAESKLTPIPGKLDFYDCGELAGSFACPCGASIAFSGNPSYRFDDTEAKPGFALWCYIGDESFFLKFSETLTCLYCKKVFDLITDISINEKEHGKEESNSNS